MVKLVPVEGNPFETSSQPRLTPVEGNPFETEARPTASYAPRVAREGMPVNRKVAMREEIDRNRLDRFNPLGKLATGLRSAVGMIPFGDDAVAGLATALPSDFDYSLPKEERFARNRDYVEAQHESDWANDKVSSVAGGALGILAAPGGRYIAGARSLPGTMKRSAEVGALYGGATGLSSNGSVEERVQQGVQQGVLGGVLGGAAPPLISGIGAAAREVAGPMVSRYRQWRNPDAAADRMLGNALRADRDAGLAISQADLIAAEREGMPLVLGDIGGDTTRGLARAAANANPIARGTMTTMLDPRYEAQNTRMGNFVANMFDYPDPMAMSERLRVAARVTNNPAYRQLYDDFPMVGNDDLLDMLRNVPEVRQAGEAVMARTPGLQAAGMSNGRMSTGPMPSIEFWDRLQRELRDRANGASGDRAAEVSTLYSNLRERIVGQLDTLTGGRYDAVRGGAARFFRADDALEAGQNFFRQNGLNDLAGARRALESMSEADRNMFAQGFAAELAHATGNTRPGQHIGVQGWLVTPNAQQKMRLALGRDRADSIEMMTNVEAAMNKLRSEVKGNSTSVRQLIESGVMGAGLNTMLGGELGWSTLTSPEGIMLALARGAASRNKGLSPAVAERLARRLISNDPEVVGNVLQQARRSEAVSNFLRDFQSQMIKLGSMESDAVLPAPMGFAEGGEVDSMAGFLPPDAAAPMREEMGPPMAAPAPMTAETLPELDPFAGEKALGRGAMEAAGTAGRYLRDTPLSQIPSDAGKLGGMMWEGAKEDPVGFVLDVLPIIGETRSGMEARDLLFKADEAEKAGDVSMASQLRQFAAVAAAGAIPAAGMGARVAKRAGAAGAGAAAGPPTLSSIIQRGVPIEPRTPRPDDAAREAALADTRVGGDIVGQRINTLVPEQDRVVGGTYTPGAPGGTRWADMPEEVLSQPGVGFRVADEELQQLWQDSVAQSSAAAKAAVAENGVTPQFLSKDWDDAMKTPLRDHLWYELSGERLAENMPDLSPDEFMQFMDLIGATSARAAPGENLERALGVLSQKLQGRPVDVDLTIPSTVQQALGRSHSGGSSALPGNKTGYFSDTLALTGGVPTRFPISVNDVWVGKMFGVPDDVMSSNQALHEPMAIYFNKIRDLYNERHGGEVPFQYQSWNFQAPAWVHLRNKEAGATSGDAYHQVWGGILDKLKAAGVKGIKGDVITREALMDPKFADAVRRTTGGWRDAPKATVEFGTTQTNVGRTAYDLYRQSIDAGDELSQQDYLKALTTAMYQSGRGQDHPWDSLKKAVTGVMGAEGEITRIAAPTTDAPLDIGGTFEGMVSPNIRVPLKDMSDAQIRYFNALAGGPLRQDAMAASQFLDATPDAPPREGYIRTHAIFVPTTEAITPAEIRTFAKAMSEAGHDLSYARYPNGYKFDILPNFNGDAPVGPTPDALWGVYNQTLGGRFAKPELMDHDFKSVYTPADDYSAARIELLQEMKNDYVKQAIAAGVKPRAAERFAERAADPKARVSKTLTGRGRKAWDSYRARLGALANAEQGFQGLAERVATGHATFIEKATKRFERARKRAEKAQKVEKKAQGGPVGRLSRYDDPEELHEYLLATASLEQPPRRFAMGGPVFPAAVNNRIGALSRRH